MTFTAVYLQIKTCWDLVYERSDFDTRRAAVEEFNAKSRFRKRGLALIPTKFGISFTAKFLNQVSRSACFLLLMNQHSLKLREKRSQQSRAAVHCPVRFVKERAKWKVCKDQGMPLVVRSSQWFCHPVASCISLE